MFTLLGFTLPLCLDDFALSFGVLGQMRLTVAQRVRISVLLIASEIAMPVVGMAVGTPLTHLTGSANHLLIDGVPANPYQIHAANLSHAADVFEYSFFGRYIDPILVPLVIGAVAIWILDETLNDDDDDEAGKVREMATAHGLSIASIIGLVIVTSLDNLIIGFALAFNAYYLPLHEIFTAIVILAVLAVMAGQFIGWKVRTGSFRLNVERIATASKVTAGGVLVALAAVILITPEITTHVIPHIYHYRYIPPLPPSPAATPHK
jgi:putative Mn2+ efflux pump MntP